MPNKVVKDADEIELDMDELDDALNEDRNPVEESKEKVGGRSEDG